MAAGAPRAARSETRDVDLVHPVEQGPHVQGEEARQPGSHGGPDEDRETLGPGPAVQLEKRPDLGGVVCRAHHVAADLESCGSQAPLARGHRDHRDGRLGQVRAGEVAHFRRYRLVGRRPMVGPVHRHHRLEPAVVGQ